MLKAWLWRHDRIVPILAGLFYGVLAQLAGRSNPALAVWVVMSFGYIVLLPAVIGSMTMALQPPAGTFVRGILAGLVANALCLLVAFAVGWEGSICLIAAAPVYFSLSIVGGCAGYLVRRWQARRGSLPRLTIAPVLLLPMLSAGLESQLGTGDELRVVKNTIDIHASQETVFRRIARVAPITEPQHSFFFTMGFPRPVEATLSEEAVGGVRHASFERGLVFIETITKWKPPREIRFTIDVDPNSTPTTTLDAHVTVGGHYFDVLEGGYRIEPLGPSLVRLHLDSQHRISTHYNGYTSLWSDSLMGEIQENILRVIRDRCERAEAQRAQAR